ncbi:aspartate/glutamate racemase family protein [Donghicola mangrovi]|uniref:HyuE hydantoin racemase n=1 Tax=Donghicola mangrovi TaxID=2729614 RepID=A0A850Q1V4_9RHOB|nr:aspartate/glutamate racemase family protein [Donghicola mangrovi]NVO23066.1 HyuE hydantoin racemase [Donghicola mangrovi]
MKIAYINPNSTAAMTEGIVAVAAAALPVARIIGITNIDAPSAIQGPEDGAAALPGVLRLVAEAEADGAGAIVIGCFDDTGLAEAQSITDLPVLGIGQSAYVMAGLMGRRFSVVTSLAVSIPVITENIAAGGYAPNCAGVYASHLPVLTIDEGSEPTRAHLAACLTEAAKTSGAVVLGCAGMAGLRADLARRTGVLLIDGVAASAHLAAAAAGYRRT